MQVKSTVCCAYEVFAQPLQLITNVYLCIFVQRFYKKAAAFVLRAVAKHSPELSQAVVACGGVDALVLCLEEFDPGVKEAAAWALGYIARHNDCKENTLTYFLDLI